MPYEGYGYRDLVNRSSDEIAESSALSTTSGGWWERDTGARSKAAFIPTLNIEAENENLVQTITIFL